MSTALALPREVSLFDVLPRRLAPLAPGRVDLDRSCWIDYQASWMEGADEVLGEVVDGLDWQSSRRPMYDRVVEVPRLTATVDIDAAALPRVVSQAAERLGEHYSVNFEWIGANLYRTGRDSVAWHADRVGRFETNPLVAILSLGGPRRLLFRPVGGGAARAVTMGSGDLLVMGGACQHRWEHSVPKVSMAPLRVSLTFRHGSRRP